MTLNKLLKGLFVVLPIITLTACSSPSENNDSGTNGKATTNSNNGTDTTVSQLAENGNFTEEELRQQALEKGQTVFFAFDNSQISSDYEAMLDLHAKYLTTNPTAKVTIEGHADERGTPEYNIALGERRAKAVSQYLQAAGVDASNISIMSYGEEKPLEQGQSAAAYAKNRRAVLAY